MDIKALAQLWNLTQAHPGTGGARAAAGVLLGLYNGKRFPLDLTMLRSLDRNNLAAAITVLENDAGNCRREIHEWLNTISGRSDFGMRFEVLAWEYRLPRRARKENLLPLSPGRIMLA